MKALEKMMVDLRADYGAGRLDVSEVYECCVNIVKGGNYDYTARWLTLHVVNPAYAL